MINKVELEKLQVGLLERISPHLMGARISLIQEDLIGHILLRVKGFVWAETKSTRHQEVQYPRDWREAIKERWAPAWALRRWPVCYKKVVLDVKAIYPEFRPAIPNEEAVLLITKTTEDRVTVP